MYDHHSQKNRSGLRIDVPLGYYFLSQLHFHYFHFSRYRQRKNFVPVSCFIGKFALFASTIPSAFSKFSSCAFFVSNLDVFAFLKSSFSCPIQPTLLLQPMILFSRRNAIFVSISQILSLLNSYFFLNNFHASISSLRRLYAWRMNVQVLYAFSVDYKLLSDII